MNQSITPLSQLVDASTNLLRYFRKHVGKAAAEEMERLVQQAEAAVANMEAKPIAIHEFEPLNGRIAITCISSSVNAWEVIGVAKNWPQEHHPMAVGDIVVPGVGYYNGRIVGNIAWVKPGDLMAIQRKSKPTP